MTTPDGLPASTAAEPVITPAQARARLATLRTSGSRMYSDEELANLSDEDAVMTADAFALDLPTGHHR